MTKLKFAFVLLLFSGLVGFAADMRQGKIARLVQTAHAKGEFSGVVLVAQGDKLIYAGAVGLANRTWNIPHRLDTRFRICSITKQFTALLVMQLVESGKLSLDATISEYLPEYRAETGRKIRLRDLLNSASGLPSSDDLAFYQLDEAKLSELNYVVKTYFSGDLTFAPGSRFNYNNADFIILGAIIEKVTGQSYERVLRERILSPLGMKNSGLIRHEDIIPNLAAGYVKGANQPQNEPYYRVQNYSSAGAMYSTAEDMWLWNKALMSNKLLSPKATAEMFTPSAKLGFVAFGSWAYTLKLADGKKHRLIERQGNIGGFCNLNIIAPEDKYSVTLLSNTETDTLFRTYTGEGLSYDILSALTEANK